MGARAAASYLLREVRPVLERPRDTSSQQHLAASGSCFLAVLKSHFQLVRLNSSWPLSISCNHGFKHLQFFVARIPATGHSYRVLIQHLDVYRILTGGIPKDRHQHITKPSRTRRSSQWKGFGTHSFGFFDYIFRCHMFGFFVNSMGDLDVLQRNNFHHHVFTNEQHSRTSPNGTLCRFVL